MELVEGKRGCKRLGKLWGCEGASYEVYKGGDLVEIRIIGYMFQDY